MPINSNNGRIIGICGFEISSVYFQQRTKQANYKGYPLITAILDKKADNEYDYSKYNAGRLDAFAQLDVRVDKVFYFRRCMLGVYIDLQNVAGGRLRQPDVLMSTGEIENPSAPASERRYRMKYLEQVSGTLLPTLGLTIEF